MPQITCVLDMSERVSGHGPCGRSADCQNPWPCVQSVSGCAKGLDAHAEGRAAQAASDLCRLEAPRSATPREAIARAAPSRRAAESRLHEKGRAPRFSGRVSKSRASRRPSEAQSQSLRSQPVSFRAEAPFGCSKLQSLDPCPGRASGTRPQALRRAASGVSVSRATAWPDSRLGGDLPTPVHDGLPLRAWTFEIGVRPQ